MTKVIMSEDKARTKEIDLEHMTRTTKLAYDFMYQLLTQHGEDKLLNQFLQTCKVELLINQLVKIFKNDIYSPIT